MLDIFDILGPVMVGPSSSHTAGAANAVVAAQMALAGIQSVIPPDEIIDAMYEIGCQLPACLRETSQAGLATTPTGQKIAEKLGQNQF